MRLILAISFSYWMRFLMIIDFRFWVDRVRLSMVA